MKFITIQGRIPAEVLKSGKTYLNEKPYNREMGGVHIANDLLIPQEYGYKPIYISPITTYTKAIADMLRIMCTDAEYAIVFETENYDVMNLREFYKSVQGVENYNYRDDKRFVGEYITSEIRPENVIDIVKFRKK